jgi:hypothetical protein
MQAGVSIFFGYTVIKVMANSGVLDGVNGDYNTLGFKYSDPLVWGACGT